MKIRRFTRYEGESSPYIHGGRDPGVMVGFETDLADKAEFKDYAKDIAMQVAASAPTYLDKASVPSETIEKGEGDPHRPDHQRGQTRQHR